MQNNDEKEFSINDLINELNVNNKSVKEKQADFNLSQGELENFVLNSTGKLVTQGLEIIDGVKDVVMNNPESREVEALAEALKAVSSALSVIKDIHITHIKKDAAKDIKKLEIDSRKLLKDDDRKERFLLTRDEIFKKILEDAKTIEAEAVTVSIHPTLSS